jgi:F0F1-type ATP synthase alpha subunit
VASVLPFRAGLLDFMESVHPEIGSAIASEQKISDDTKAALMAAISEYKSSFVVEG